jgi:hypothetical protein
MCSSMKVCCFQLKKLGYAPGREQPSKEVEKCLQVCHQRKPQHVMGVRLKLCQCMTERIKSRWYTISLQRIRSYPSCLCRSCQSCKCDLEKQCPKTILQTVSSSDCFLGCAKSTKYCSHFTVHTKLVLHAVSIICAFFHVFAIIPYFCCRPKRFEEHERLVPFK